MKMEDAMTYLAHGLALARREYVRSARSGHGVDVG